MGAKEPRPSLIVPSRDTRLPPDVTPATRIISILGLTEPPSSSSGNEIASPSESDGDGWMVSDFYLWMHVLDGMGKAQEWITSLELRYLMETATEFLHGDSFEDRAVVLDGGLIPLVREKVTIAPRGLEQRNFFFARLEDTLAAAAVDNDPVLVMVLGHGDFYNGGLLLGVDPCDFKPEEDTVSAKTVSSILAKYPSVHLTMFMTSCYSGHWVETATFQGQRMTVVAAETERNEISAFLGGLAKELRQ